MKAAIPKEKLIARARAIAEEMSVRVYEGGGEDAVIDAHLAEIALASLTAGLEAGQQLHISPPAAVTPEVMN